MPQLWANEGAFYRFNNILSSANGSKYSLLPPPLSVKAVEVRILFKKEYSSSECSQVLTRVNYLDFILKVVTVIIIFITIIETRTCSVVQDDLELTT